MANRLQSLGWYNASCQTIASLRTPSCPTYNQLERSVLLNASRTVYVVKHARLAVSKGETRRNTREAIMIRHFLCEYVHI